MKLTIDGYKNIKKNKYFKWYKDIIIKRINTSIDINQYSEHHHILPVCMGGLNNPENLVKLTAREHFIVHICLVKFTSGKEHFKMLFAFRAMNMKNQKSTSERYINSRIFQYLRTDFASAVSVYSKRKWSEPEYRAKMKKYSLEHSPFKNKVTHRKTMQTRKERGTNVFVINNPMKYDGEAKRSKVEKTSGENHWLRKTRKFYYRYNHDDQWKLLNTIEIGVEKACIKMGWKLGTFNTILIRNVSPKRGTMAGVEIKRVIYEN